MQKFLSCNLLNSQLTLWPDGIMTPCCMGIFSNLKESNLKLPANTHRFNHEKWQKMIDNVNYNFKRGIIPFECNNCPCLKISDECIKHNSSFIVINIINSRLCNIDCNFCYLKKEFKTLDNSFSSHIGMFSDMIKKGLITCNTLINWGGGEPALHPSLKELYGMFRNSGCRQHFDTNATIYMDFLQDDIASGQTSISCSLMSSNNETYKNLMGKPLCQTAWDNAAKYASLGGDTRAKFIFLPENDGEEEDFAQACWDNDISIINMDRNIYGNNAADDKYLNQREDRMKVAAAQLGIDILYGVGIYYKEKGYHLITKNFFENGNGNGREHNLSIKICGKNEAALANQIFFLGIQSDFFCSRDMRTLPCKKNAGWELRQYSIFANEYYYYTQYTGYELEFYISFNKNIILHFLSHAWSGKIAITIDYTKEKIYDLYSPEHSHLYIDILNDQVIKKRRIF